MTPSAIAAEIALLPSGIRESLRDSDVVYALHRGNACAGHDSPDNSRLVTGCTVVVCTHRREKSLAAFLESLRRQDPPPQAIVIVDASSDEDTQRLVSEDPELYSFSGCLTYLRVQGRWKGLTRQRNFALQWVRTDLLVFFDDDVVLLPGCLAEMQRVHREYGPAVVGVGAIVHNEGPEPHLRKVWRFRRRLGIVATLEPGRYSRSGMSTPWGAIGADRALLEGDWLPGCGMMWKTATVVDLGFNDAFEGYSLGEDVDFSLRARQKGKLIMTPAARLLHLQPKGGRPDGFKLGYFTIYNRYQIHRRGLNDRTRRDVAAFIYAWTLDSLIVSRRLVYPKRAGSILEHLRGRLRAALDLLKEAVSRTRAQS
ncbi:MAG: glycosyltransferase [Acidobacteriota bacterium]